MMRAVAGSTAIVLAFAGLLHERQPAPLVVHEWGTITTHHDSNGTPRGRLNRIASSEVLPAFVHRYEPPATRDDPSRGTVKTPLTPGRPDVTMRLETPVMYFYPPDSGRTIAPFDVNVSFRGGILNEFYPNADASVAVDVDRIREKMQAGLVPSWDGATLDNYVVGRLSWRGVALRNAVTVPATTSAVWLAPRKVRATSAVMPGGEGERYLFYRGVAHLDALVQTRLSATGVDVRAPAQLLWLAQPSMTIRRLWLVDIRANGGVAFREQKDLVVAKNNVGGELTHLPLFSASDYSAGRPGELRQSMKHALTESGLFEDEAAAMLETWNESYFRRPGLRLFYIVPPEWIAYFLPLQISTPSVVTRVLVGRIELNSRD